MIEATKEIGGNVERAAVEAVGGAVKAAGMIGNTAVVAVRDILVGVAGGAKDILAAALPSSGARSADAPTRPAAPAAPRKKR